MRLPADGGSPFLDLQTEFRDLAFAKVPDYLPSRILKAKLTDWFEHAFVDGRIPQGTLVFRGVVADFPFDARQGRFLARLTVRDCTLNFHRDWPPLTGLAGEVRFENHGMWFSLAEGLLLDSKLIEVSAHIPDMGRAVAVEVQGRAEGPFTDNLRILGETPLRKRLGVLARVFEPTGKARLDLDIAIPLGKRHRDSLRITGELGWPGPATLAIPDQGILLTGLAGSLHFTAHNLQARSIEARLWGVPVRLGVATRRSGKEATVTTRILVTGRFPAAVLARQFPAQAWGLLQGRTHLALELRLTEADLGGSVPPLDFDLTSDLAGLALALPAPLGKPAAEARRLRLSSRLARQKMLGIRGSYGDLGIALGLERGEDGRHRLVRGAFNLGGLAPPLPEREGLHLGGSVAALDLRPWLDWWADHKGPGTGDSGGGATLRSAQVRVGRLSLPATTLNEVRFELDDQGHSWAAQLDARELAGKITVPRRVRGGPARVRLARLDLKDLFDQKHRDGKASADRPHTDPRQARALDLGIEQLLWGEHSLGRATLRSQLEPGGLEFTRISLTGPVMAIRGRGSWRRRDAGPRSNLSLTARSRDLGKFLRGLGFKSLLHKTPAKLDLDLGWSGAPGRFAAADLKGHIRFDLGAGSLLEVEPGVGRVLGLLNLGALRRRLDLDFNDLFGSGYAFEKISGRFDIAQGSATTRELLIEGSSADVSSVPARPSPAPWRGDPWSGWPSSWSIRYPMGRSTSWAATSITSADPGPSPRSGAADARSRHRKRRRPGHRGPPPAVSGRHRRESVSGRGLTVCHPAVRRYPVRPGRCPLRPLPTLVMGSVSRPEDGGPISLCGSQTPCRFRLGSACFVPRNARSITAKMWNWPYPRMNALSGSKTKTAAIQIAGLGSTLEIYYINVGRYPTTAEGLQALVENPGNVINWNGPYLGKSKIPKDPWGFEYRYRSPGEHGSFDLSLGADNREGGEGENRDVSSWDSTTMH